MTYYEFKYRFEKAKHDFMKQNMKKEKDVSPLKTQIGWDHYKKLKIQPFEYIVANKLWFWEWAVIKYVTRWKDKNWVEDLKKSIHILEMMIELEEKYGSKERS